MSNLPEVRCHDTVTVAHARHLIKVYGKDKDHPWFLEWAQAIDALACENERLLHAIDKVCNVLTYADNDDQAADASLQLLRALVSSSDEKGTHNDDDT